MSRARATALALVNWKGVFYERYLLDTHVTALEGENGAGKTTVMIAAYVVLMPDLTRLRFSNVGEGAPSGGDRGLWGRLGDSARPSFAALEIALGPGEHLIAGVCLEKKTEPALAITPFLVSHLNLSGRLSELLLVSDAAHDALPDLGDVRANAERLGGRLQTFSSTKEYFTTLFEQGVTPLRLATDEDRGKLNEMLRTSMTGGISRALTTDLRGFLLKEESGLGDTLGRMRSNLDACHKTRVEVREARRLEHEMAGVLDAAQAMVGAAIGSVRAAADERARRAVAARLALDELARRVQVLEDEAVELEHRKDGAAAQVAEARAARDAAIARAVLVARARAISDRIEEIGPRLDAARAAEDAARVDRDAAEVERSARRRDRDAARDIYERAARSALDSQSGLAELHRNALAFRHVTGQLETARAALEEALDPRDADAALARIVERIAALDKARAIADADTQLALVRRRERARAVEALEVVSGPVDLAHAHEQGRRALRHLVALESLAAREPQLALERERLARLAVQQGAARARAAQLGVAAGEASGQLAVATALDEHEAAARRADDESRAADDAATGAMVRREEALRRVSALDQAATRWREMRAIESRIETQTGDSIRSTADAEALRSRLEASRAALRTRIDDAARRRDEVLREAAALEASRAGVPAELARLRDELDAELFAARFEDLEPSEAARVEAELGPLTHALVVADPLAAARAIAGRSREVRSVWLLSPGAVISVASDTTTAEDVVVADGPAVRVTRVPSRPVLGRRARTRRVGELRAEAERLGTEYDQAREALRSSDSLVRDVERLSFDAVSLEIGDPSEEAAVARTEAESAERDAAAARESAGEARRRAASERGRVHALRGLLADAFLLGPPDYENMAAEASARYADARRAREELERTRSARDVLGESLDALRTHPPVDDGPSPVLAGLERERSRLFEIRDRLEDVVMHKGALAFSDADRALAERTALAPALEAQLGAAREALSAAEAALGRAESARDQMTEQFQRTAAERSALDAQAAQLESELEAAVSTLGGSAPSEAALRSAEADAERLDAACRQAEQQAVVASTDAAVAHERRAEAERAAEAARALVVAEERAAEPAAERRRGIEEAATRAGVALSGWASAGGEPREAAALASEASGRSDVLLDRLVAASGGTECAERVRRGLRDRRADALESYLSAFSIVVEWIRERLPAQLGAAPDPLSALDRLRGDLVALESGLSRQEAGLRTASEDVAVGIDVQLRRAHHQVRRLNRGLDGIGFGSVAGIRVQLRRIERMDQVLRALREGAAQELLFQPTLPIEEALDEVFRRYGGGRGGGQRILDYREYVELVVEVRRREQEAWESASPSRLSTGEAIGVGAALMMVILTEWERDANLLGPRRAGGALRFLFLDEANRLSQDSLGVLFDLCKSLDLQLLIAAPEVALAEGNTTYRLVRRTTSDGREEVLVSGRRVAPSA